MIVAGVVRELADVDIPPLGRLLIPVAVLGNLSIVGHAEAHDEGLVGALVTLTAY